MLCYLTAEVAIGYAVRRWHRSQPHKSNATVSADEPFLGCLRRFAENPADSTTVLSRTVAVKPPKVPQSKEPFPPRFLYSSGGLYNLPRKELQPKSYNVSFYIQARMLNLVIVIAESQQYPNDHHLVCRPDLLAPLLLNESQ